MIETWTLIIIVVVNNGIGAHTSISKVDGIATEAECKEYAKKLSRGFGRDAICVRIAK